MVVKLGQGGASDAALDRMAVKLGELVFDMEDVTGKRKYQFQSLPPDLMKLVRRGLALSRQDAAGG